MGKHELDGHPEKHCVFLDRDGVLNEPIVRNRRPYPPAGVEEVNIYDDVLPGCAQLKAVGFVLVVVTNQPDVGRGTQDRASVEEINRRLAIALPMLDRFEVCFHSGDKDAPPCLCRKPQPGMLLRAARALKIDLSRSYMVGDRGRDIYCAKMAGCRAIFIDRGYKEQLRQRPDLTVTSFAGAVAGVLEFERERLLAFDQPEHVISAK